MYKMVEIPTNIWRHHIEFNAYRIENMIKHAKGDNKKKLRSELKILKNIIKNIPDAPTITVRCETVTPIDSSKYDFTE